MPAVPTAAAVAKLIEHGEHLYLEGKATEALETCLQGLALAPDNPVLFNQRGRCAAKLGDWTGAEAAYRRATALNADYAEAHYNLAILFHENRRFDEAELAYRRVIELAPGDAQAHHNLGALLYLKKHMAEAEACYRRAIDIKPDYIEARHNLGMLLLHLGQLAEGWPEYETRHAPGQLSPGAAAPPAPQGGAALFRHWNGEPLQGRSLLIWPEQGFGDVIQFVRYLPLIRARGARHLTLVCQRALEPLLAAQDLADLVVCIEDWRPEMGMRFDFWCFVLSLPLHFGTTLENLPARIPYMAANPDSIGRWEARLPAARFRVALAWKGNPAHVNDCNRSLPSINTLMPLWSLPDIAFVSLQKGSGEEEIFPAAAMQPLTHLGGRINDFADLAAILSRVDLLICVDTAIAHLAGALGRPCWLLLPWMADWRWLEDRTDSPWYPGTTRLFRQNSGGDWDSVVANLVIALREWIAQQATGNPRAPAATGESRLAAISMGDDLAQSEQHPRYGQEYLGSLKRFNLRALSADTGIRTLLQSGTGLGASLQWAIQSRFDAIHSVERKTCRHAEAVAMLAGNTRVCLAEDDGVAFLRTHGPAISGPKLVYLNAHFARGASLAEGVHERSLNSPEASSLLDEVASLKNFFGPEDVLIIDDARVVQPGDFQLGECPPSARCWHQLPQLEALLDTWTDSHFLCVLHSDQGYFCLIPNCLESRFPSWLNALPHDTGS